MTYKQAADEQDGRLARARKVRPSSFGNSPMNTPRLDENGQPVKVTVPLERPRVFFATVFNGEQIDGLPPIEARKPPQWNAHEQAEQILKVSGAVIQYAPETTRFLSSVDGYNYLPDRGQLPTADSFYSVALHEIGHNADTRIMPRAFPIYRSFRVNLPISCSA